MERAEGLRNKELVENSEWRGGKGKEHQGHRWGMAVDKASACFCLGLLPMTASALLSRQVKPQSCPSPLPATARCCHRVLPLVSRLLKSCSG